MILFITHDSILSMKSPAGSELSQTTSNDRDAPADSPRLPSTIVSVLNKFPASLLFHTIQEYIWLRLAEFLCSLVSKFDRRDT